MMNTALQSLSCDLRRRWLAWRAGKGPEALARALSAVQQDIPVLLVSYNNGVYVQHMTQQLRALGLCPVVLDNASTDGQTKDVLVRLSRSGDAQVVRLGYNFGHKVAFLPPFYDILPDVFSCSDPDLLLNEDMPQDFLRQLHEVAQRYRVFKAGLALDLPDDLEVIDAAYVKVKCKPFPFRRVYSVREWEARFWRKPLDHPTLEVYAAPVDTTLAVYDKRLYDGDFFDAVRVAGAFRCLHLPWHPRVDLFDAQTRKRYLQGNRISSWLKKT
ncbi:MAG: hypothetical protein WCZ20_01815 [Hydrogenophaga sp.]|uniref:hypothetical protein n=1 Tax=Hydrogenophaga sp. TaxID=1904254 RepID=UPI00262298D6|nr:hypothetical protein [Hydrogenophaga sp.]MDD3784195.1 hypothetical protein [Hydrogenophaga sp.]